MVVVGVVGIDSLANMTLRQKDIEKLRQGNPEGGGYTVTLVCIPTRSGAVPKRSGAVFRTRSERMDGAWKGWVGAGSQDWLRGSAHQGTVPEAPDVAPASSSFCGILSLFGRRDPRLDCPILAGVSPASVGQACRSSSRLQLLM